MYYTSKYWNISSKTSTFESIKTSLILVFGSADTLPSNAQHNISQSIQAYLVTNWELQNYFVYFPKAILLYCFDYFFKWQYEGLTKVNFVFRIFGRKFV